MPRGVSVSMNILHKKETREKESLIQGLLEELFTLPPSGQAKGVRVQARLGQV